MATSGDRKLGNIRTGIGYSTLYMKDNLLG